jgi:hypothetical protein
VVEAAGALELEPVAVMIVDGGCARAAMVGKRWRKSGEEEGSMQWRR